MRLPRQVCRLISTVAISSGKNLKVGKVTSCSSQHGILLNYLLFQGKGELWQRLTGRARFF